MCTTRFSVAACALAALAAAQLSTARLRVEYLVSPVGLDEPTPRFSFAAVGPPGPGGRGTTVSARRIVVREAAVGVVVWDSGKLPGNTTTNIAYAGARLGSDKSYTWSAQWWDQAGSASAATTAGFSTGLFSAADWRGAAFVGGGSRLRAEFVVAAPVARARLFIVGLGDYRAMINGLRTDDHVLGPFTTFAERVLYDAWDVTALVHEGCNAIAVELGGGWYAHPSVGAGPRSLRVLLSVDAPDGARTHLTSQLGAGAGALNFAVATGPVTADDLLTGEGYDARLEQPGWAACGFANASAWVPAVGARDALASAAQSWRAVHVTVAETVAPVSVTEPLPGTFVVDFGRYMAAMLTVNVVCPAGPQRVSMRFGDALGPDGTVVALGGDMVANYTCAGTGRVESYTTAFTYYWLRYAEVTNWPGAASAPAFAAHIVHAAVAQVGALSFGGGTALDRLQHLINVAARSNLMDVPTDSPRRDRRGWLGHAQFSAETLMHTFDVSAYLSKFVRDIGDAQRYFEPALNGSIPDAVPFYGHGVLAADPAWGAAFPLITSWLSGYAADDRIVATHFAGIRTFVDSQVRQLERGELTVRYGDWCSLAFGPETGCDDVKSPDIGMAYVIKGIDVLTRFATRLGRTGDVTHYGRLSAQFRSRYNDAWLNASSGVYAPGAQIDQILALDLGVTPDPAATAAALVNLIARGAHAGRPNTFTGGAVASKYILPVLSAAGRDDLAITLMLAMAPSLDWVNLMSGAFGAWMYARLGGVARAPGSRGWSALLVSPAAFAHPDLVRASASIDTAGGRVAVDWTTVSADVGACNPAVKRADCADVMLQVTASVPVGSTASIHLRTGGRAVAGVIVTEGGATVFRRGAFVPGVTGVTGARAALDGVVVDVGSGRYVLQVVAADSEPWLQLDAQAAS